MRKYIDIINEAIRPTRTRTRSRDFVDVAPDSLGDLAPTDQRTVSDPLVSPSDTTGLHKASAADTARAWARGGAPAMTAGGMSNILRDLEGIEDTEAGVTPGFDATAALSTDMGHDTPLALPAGHTEATNANLPVVLNQAIAASGEAVAPDWHQIQNLPGYIQGGIRQVARQVFRQFTNTPIEEIQMVCTLLNPDREVRQTAEWIVQNGVEVDGATYDFSENMPEYARMAGATVAKLYRVGGHEFLIMRDNGGHYIYGWAGSGERVTDPRNNRAALPPR